jgi:glyoxylase-like metal-dependent hydrolase (beta-lactamase superfamily II)
LAIDYEFWIFVLQFNELVNHAARVDTANGPCVLASDASHFYAHFEQQRAFPVLYNLAELLEGYRALNRLAGPNRRIIPGHDPLVLARYPAASDETAGTIARLDLNLD